MLKRFFCICLTLLLLLPPMAVQAEEEVSWFSLLEAYMAAEKAGDEPKMLQICLDVMEFYGLAEDLDACINALPSALRVAKYYEARGDYDTARWAWEYYRHCLVYIDEHSEENYYDAIRGADAILAHYAFTDPIVVAASDAPKDVPYFGAIGEPEVGTYVGMCDTYDETTANAYLLYAHFGTEDIQDYSWLLPKTEKPYLLEVAWNIPKETFAELRAISAGKLDQYIERNLTYLASLTGVQVLIRFSAEVNCWGDLPQSWEDAEKNMADRAQDFIDAFRHVATMADKYAPKAAMVFSPNDVSNWYADMTDFYPGDEYVDWVGVSTYMNRSSAEVNEYGNDSDAFYCLGKYENQFVKMGEVVKAFGDRKPILISECGYAYKSANTKQTEAHAVAKLREFYENIGIVYPEVKAILYFNTNIGGDHFSLSSSKKLREAYEKAIRENRAIAGMLDGTGIGYTALEHMAEMRDAVELYTYIRFPGDPEVTVTYTLDGVEIGQATKLPYKVTMDMRDVTAGEHTLKVHVQAGVTEREKTVTFVTKENGFIGDAMASVTDVTEEDAIYEAVRICLENGYMRAVGGKFCPQDTVSRAELITMLAAIENVDAAKYTKKPSYTDLNAGEGCAPYVQWAESLGIRFGGTTNRFGSSMFYGGSRKFDGDKAVTEKELTTILEAYAKKCDVRFAQDWETIVDAKSTKAITRAALAEILSGME